MAFSQDTFTWTANPLTLTFDALRDKYLTVTVAGTPTTDWTLNGRELSLGGTPVNGSTVVVTRSTDLGDDDFLVQFTDASSLRAEDLTTATTQLLHMIQEIVEGNQGAITGFYLPLDSSRTFWDATGGGPSNVQIQNLAEPTVADAAATKNYVDSQIAGTGQVPATTDKEYRALYVKTNGDPAWQYRPHTTITFMCTDPGPTTGLSPLTSGYIDAFGGRYIKTPTGSAGNQAHDPGDAALDCVLGWTQTARTRDASMEAFVNPLAQIKAASGDKVIQVTPTQGGWSFSLNILAKARKAQGAANYTQDNLGFHVLFYDENNGDPRVLNVANDYIDAQIQGIADRFDTEDVISGASLTPGTIAFPQGVTNETPGLNQFMQLDGLVTTSGLYSRTESVQSYTFTGQLPVTGNPMNLRISVISTGTDDVVLARPTTLTLTTNPGYLPAGN